MQRLCTITVPGLSVKQDFTAARRRLLADFPEIQEVVATTSPGTLVVLCSGTVEHVDAWRDALRGEIATAESKTADRRHRRRRRSFRGDDFAA
jgi:hypothetical protein